MTLSRRGFLCKLPAVAALPAVHALSGREAAAAPAGTGHAGHGGTEVPGESGRLLGHAGTRGRVDPRVNGFDPQEILRDFDAGTTSRLPDGRTLREWKVVAQEKEIEIAPGVKYPAWTYNGRVPGPTFRAREGERLRITFINGTRHAHTMHFHGIHRDNMDGVVGFGPGGHVNPGERYVYEFDAEPFGLHLYHCHTTPLADHIAKGLYGTFIIDPKRGRRPADELVMVMAGFDTNFDRANEFYAVNTVAFEYMQRPVKVKRGELVRIYLVNVLEFDPLNSFHIHANFFHHFPTGTSLEPTELTDTIVQGQGQRSILELRFPFAGRFMFHAHVSEFAELGWMGFFEVTD